LIDYDRQKYSEKGLKNKFINNLNERKDIIQKIKKVKDKGEW